MTDFTAPPAHPAGCVPQSIEHHEKLRRLAVDDDVRRRPSACRCCRRPRCRQDGQVYPNRLIVKPGESGSSHIYKTSCNAGEFALNCPGGTAVDVRRAKAGEKHDQRPSKALAAGQCGKPKRQKKSATPKGCAEVPPKEEVLEDMRRHL